jgi:hypothetical protein
MQMKKNWIVLPAAFALGVSSLAFAQQNRDRDNESTTARERREAREAKEAKDAREARQDRREERRADSQSGVPDRVQRAIVARYSNAKVTPIETVDANGVQTFRVKIDTDQGDTTARATERGDFLYLGYPGVTYDRLPRPVTSVLEGMFNGKPETVQKYEQTTYLVNADFGNKSYQLRINAVGRLIDATPVSEVKKDDPAQYPRASRDDEQALQPRLKDYFDSPKVKSVHRYPEAEGYFWVNVSTATEDDVWVLMDTKREVAQYRTRVQNNEVPQPVTRAMREFFKGAKTDQVYRDNVIQYNILQPVGDEAVLVAITPLGDIRHIRQAGGADIRREFNDRDPDELFRSRENKRDDNRNDNNRGNNNSRNSR